MVTKLETQGKQIFQWGEKFVDIATLEKAVYEAVLSLGRNIMRKCIEEAENQSMKKFEPGQGLPAHHAQNSDGRGGVPAPCLPAVRGRGAAQGNGIPAGQEHGP